MVDWGAVLVAVVLFVVLSPGLMFQIPAGSNRLVEFGTMRTSGASVCAHAAIYFALVAVLLLVVHVHVYIGT